MPTKTEIQSLLSFLAQDAKVPLATAISKVKDLQAANLTSPELLSKTSITKIQSIFTDEKQAKGILSAAKRVTKKRSSDAPPTPSPSKRSKSSKANPLFNDALAPSAIEESLTLPTTTATEDEIASTVLHTNRAPLVLAFAVTLLKYTMPNQPLSSRLSLAQAVVSVNSRTKAVNIGLASGPGAEEEGWGQGQPGVRVMGREVKVMRRHGYDPTEGSTSAPGSKTEVTWDTQSTLKQEDGDTSSQSLDHAVVKEEGAGVRKNGGEEEEEEGGGEPPLWGLDLEALKKTNGPLLPGAQRNDGHGLPIYRAEHARAYLLKSFAPAPSPTEHKGNKEEEGKPAKKMTASLLVKEKEENLARLLKALDLLYSSWAKCMKTEELDRKAWGWYVNVRPEVKDGVAGWGGKGQVKLERILAMRRGT